MTLNEHEIPSGGWQFYQPETKWRAPTPISSTLNQTVMLIVAMRRKNPAITAKFKLATNTEAVKSELLRFNRKRLGLSEESTPSPFQTFRRSSSGGAGGAAGGRGVIDSMSGFKRAAQGTAVVLDWLGSGANTVSQELAEKRAATCVQCQNNVPGSWYTEAPAEIIKKAVEAWKTMTGKVSFEFKTEQGDKLKSCDTCKCLLPLKVFVPMEHIIQKTRPDVMEELPSLCWIARRDA